MKDGRIRRAKLMLRELTNSILYLTTEDSTDGFDKVVENLKRRREEE